MPRMDGLELCRRVRAHGPSYTCFIFLTMLEDKQHVLEGMHAGADDYLTKPLHMQELQVRLIAASRVTSLHCELAQRDGERNHAELLKDLAEISPPFSARLVVNGRWLLLNSVIKLVEQLPADTRLGRRGSHIFISPDPFAVHQGGLYQDPGGPQLVRRRLEQQQTFDMMNRLKQVALALADGGEGEERSQRSWWRKLGRS